LSSEGFQSKAQLQAATSSSFLFTNLSEISHPGYIVPEALRTNARRCVALV
jgi:hypothetical protein